MNKEASELGSYTTAEQRAGENHRNFFFFLMKVWHKRSKLGGGEGKKKTFGPNSKGWKSIFSQLCHCLPEYKSEERALIKSENTKRNMECRLSERCFKDDSFVQKGCQRLTTPLRYIVHTDETTIAEEFILRRLNSKKG